EGKAPIDLNIEFRIASPDYFRTMRIPVLRGRSFTDADRDGAIPVALVNEATVRTFFPGEDPLGKRMKLGGVDTPFPWVTIVGVVNDVAHRGLDASARPEMYVPLLQPPLPGFGVQQLFLTVRARPGLEGLAEAIRGEVLQLDKDQPVYSVMTMEDRISESV